MQRPVEVNDNTCLPCVVQPLVQCVLRRAVLLQVQSRLYCTVVDVLLLFRFILRCIDLQHHSYTSLCCVVQRLAKCVLRRAVLLQCAMLNLSFGLAPSGRIYMQFEMGRPPET
jgi:hypothetical protein